MPELPTSGSEVVTSADKRANATKSRKRRDGVEVMSCSKAQIMSKRPPKLIKLR
jgi:hypothetical protein